MLDISGKSGIEREYAINLGTGHIELDSICNGDSLIFICDITAVESIFLT